MEEWEGRGRWPFVARNLFAGVGRGRVLLSGSHIEIEGVSEDETEIEGMSGMLIEGVGGPSLTFMDGDSSMLMVGMTGAEAIEAGNKGLFGRVGSVLVDLS